MKLTLKESIVLAEARDPNLKYTAKEAKKVIDKVTVELTSHQSGSMTKLAKEYFQLDKSIKKMESEREKLNAHLKDEVEALFDAEDIIYTRVVETCSFIATLNKVSKPKPKVEIDYTSIIAELTKMIPEDLRSKVDEITAAYTKITQTEPKSPGFRTEPKESLERAEVSLEEGVMDFIKTIKKIVGSLVKSVAKWAVSYDKKLTKLKLEAGV